VRAGCGNLFRLFGEHVVDVGVVDDLAQQVNLLQLDAHCRVEEERRAGEESALPL
jgi:hypothetical protein